MRKLILAILLLAPLAACKTIPPSTGHISLKRYPDALSGNQNEAKIPGKYLIYIGSESARFGISYQNAVPCKFSIDKDRIIAAELLSGLRELIGKTFESFDIRLGLPDKISVERGYDDVFLVSPMAAGATLTGSEALKNYFTGPEARVFHVISNFDFRVKQTGGYGGNPVTFVKERFSRDIKPVNTLDPKTACPSLSREIADVASTSYHSGLNELGQTLRRLVEERKSS